MNEELYKDFADMVHNAGKDLYEEMVEEIKHLLIEFSACGTTADETNEAAYDYAKIIMKLVMETKYEW